MKVSSEEIIVDELLSLKRLKQIICLNVLGIKRNVLYLFLTRSCSKSSIVDGYSVRSSVALGFAFLPCSHTRGLAALAVPFFRQLDGLSNLTLYFDHYSIKMKGSSEEIVDELVLQTVKTVIQLVQMQSELFVKKQQLSRGCFNINILIQNVCYSLNVLRIKAVTCFGREEHNTFYFDIPLLVVATICFLRSMDSSQMQFFNLSDQFQHLLIIRESMSFLTGALFIIKQYVTA
ncbi:Hypothetical_protein [Hexamita inflata]|uniref:Hypothetical_protein n=1 Tax=Hexamita inflata TaxID=28002 RepID=A0ABP1GE64_9EUKA